MQDGWEPAGSESSEPLVAVDDWPVDHVAVAAVTRAGVVGQRGPTDRVFPMASVTKLLVAYAVLVAVEEGTVDLDEPAGPPGATVRHLMAHASGLPFEGTDPVTSPGARRIYSNSGFETLAAHLEARTGLAVGTYLAEAVLDPLAMGSTRLDGSPAKDGSSTVADLTRFTSELWAPTLLAPSTLAAATTVTYPGLAGILPGIGRMDPNDWGLGFELRDHKQPHWTGTRNSPRTFGHFGGAGTFLWADPGAGVALVCLTDRPFGDWALDVWPPLADVALDKWAVRPTT
jgi:CubicO group peptidase (beta-lactamase class C family)